MSCCAGQTAEQVQAVRIVGPPKLTYKIAILGNSNSGKTTLIHRLVHGTMPDVDKPTCGVGYNDYMVADMLCQIWDTAGQEKYGALVPVYIRDTDLCLIALSCCESAKVNAASLAHWTKMVETVSSACSNAGSSTTRIVVVGTKCDLVVSECSNAGSIATKQQQRCECSKQDYLLTSSLLGVGIDELRDLLAREIAESLRTDR